MIDRSTICEEICRHARVKRLNPTRKLLSKREMEAVLMTLSRNATEIEQLKSENKALRSK